MKKEVGTSTTTTYSCKECEPALRSSLPVSLAVWEGKEPRPRQP
jgi:hypothetical protein